MHKRRIPLRLIIILLITLIFSVIFAVFVYLYDRHSDYLIYERGEDLLQLQNNNINGNLSAMFLNILTATTFYGDYIEDCDLYNKEDLSEIQSYTLSKLKEIKIMVPQISAILYGDNQKRFTGYLSNKTGTIQMLLSDPSTNYNLQIYDGEGSSFPIIKTLEKYDPTLRPWYKPVAENLSIQWINPFTSYAPDEPLSISCVKPIFNDEQLVGVIGTEVQLGEINDFLLGQEEKGSGIIYIMNSDKRIVASSTSEDFFHITGGSSKMITLGKANECSNPIIRTSAIYLENNAKSYNKTFKIVIDSKPYYALISRLDIPASLGFYIVTVIPEDDIVGTINDNQTFGLAILFLIFVAGILINFALLSRVLQPLRKISENALRVSDHNFSLFITEETSPIREIHELTSAFNRMLTKIENSFEELRLSEIKFRTLVENSEDMISNLLPSGEILMQNSTAARYSKMTSNDFIGKNILTLFPKEEDSILIKMQWEKMLKTRRKVTFVHEVNYDTIEKKIFSVHLIPQFDKFDEMTNVIFTQTDITEVIEAREKIEYLLKEENEHLESLVAKKTKDLNTTMKELMNKEKMASLGNLVAGISHEINTPLGVAISASSFLKDENNRIIAIINSGDLTKQMLADYIDSVEESTRIIMHNLERASNLVASFKKISVNQSVEEKTNFNFHSFLQTILLVLKHEYKNSNHEIAIDCPDDLFVNSFPGVFSQIFTNLIMNSLIHAFPDNKPGKIAIAVSLKDTSENDSKILRIEYRDNGIGILKKNLPHIFDPFFTTTRGTDTRSGSGLGLNIVYNLVTVTLQGSISCESEPHNGVFFLIEVPYL